VCRAAFVDADLRAQHDAHGCSFSEARPEYVRCLLCDIWTRTPTDEGLCPISLWSDDHYAYMEQRMRRAS